MAWTSYDIPAIMIEISNTGGLNAETKIHPTQKPVELYKAALIRLGIKKGQSVFDSHMGSQSLRIACYDLEINFYGCEIAKDYFKTGCERFEAHKRKCEEIKEYGYAKSELEKVNPILF